MNTKRLSVLALVAGVALLLIAAASTTVTYFRDIRADVVTSTKAYQNYQGALTHAGTVTLNFNAANTVAAITLTGNVTFATSNLQTNRTYRLKIIGTATNSIPTFPATWKFLGGAPTVITSNQWSMLSLESWGTTDASVVAAFGESQ